MTTVEFKKAKIIDILKDNLFFIGNYKGPIDFYKIDNEYANFFSRFKLNLGFFVDSLYTFDKNADNFDEAILMEQYIAISNSLYNRTFKTTGTNLRLKDVFKLIQLWDSRADSGEMLCYLLELKYHKKFSLGYFHGNNGKYYEDLKATFVCPADTDGWVYDKVATSCWNGPVNIFKR